MDLVLSPRFPPLSSSTVSNPVKHIPVRDRCVCVCVCVQALEETTVENSKIEHEVALLRTKVHGELKRSKSAPSLVYFCGFVGERAREREREICIYLLSVVYQCLTMTQSALSAMRAHVTSHCICIYIYIYIYIYIHTHYNDVS